MSKNRVRGPSIIGRLRDGARCERAKTWMEAEHAEPYVSAAIGRGCAVIFRSADTQDRGGVILRLAIQDDAGSWFPHAVQYDGGVDLHICGDTESAAVLAALRAVLEAAP